MKVYLVEDNQELSYHTTNFSDINETIFEDSQEGDYLTITVMEMTEEEFAALPEID